MSVRTSEQAATKATDAALTAFMAFQDVARGLRIEPLACEFLAFNRGGEYAGTADFAAWIEGELAIGELKTSKALYGMETIQTAAHGASLAVMRPREISGEGGRRFSVEGSQGRVYALQNPEQVVPSVTTIIDAIDNKKGLMYWAADCERLAWWEAAENGALTDVSSWAHRRFGTYKNGKPRRAFEAVREAAADTGTEAHKLAELWLQERVPGPDALRDAVLDVRGEKIRPDWMPWGYIIRLPKDIEKETEPEVVRVPPDQMRYHFREGFMLARRWYAYRQEGAGA